jgi:hypothetical protein
MHVNCELISIYKKHWSPDAGLIGSGPGFNHLRNAQNWLSFRRSAAFLALFGTEEGQAGSVCTSRTGTRVT